jgi:hypothetical protein
MQKLTSLLRTIDEELKCVNGELQRAAAEKAELSAQLQLAQVPRATFLSAFPRRNVLYRWRRRYLS